MDGIGIMITGAVSRLGRPNIGNGIIMAVACTVVASIRVTTAYRNNPMDGTIMITDTGPKWIIVAAVEATVAAVAVVFPVVMVVEVAATVVMMITMIMVATAVATVVPVVTVAVITGAEEEVAAMVAVAATAGAT